MSSLEECQGCGKEGIAGFCDDCEFRGVYKSSGVGIGGFALAKVTSIELANYKYSCQCTTCRIHREMGSDAKPWKCLKPKSVGPGGFFCSECMHEMSYNSYLDKYTYDDETKPFAKAAKEGNVESFLADVTDVTNNSDHYVICESLYKAYSKYCENNDLKAKSYVAFGGELAHLDIDIEKRRKTIDQKQVWAYSGLRLKEVV